MTGVLKVDDIQDAGANSIVSSNGSGTLTFGSFSAPNITASTAILPDASDGAAIGSTSLEWSDIFLADGAVINLGDLQKLINNKKINIDAKINIDSLKKSKVLRKSINKFKILSNGEFNSKIDIEVDYSSKVAIDKIEKAGGQITVKHQSK